MTQSDHPARRVRPHGPKRRGDSTHPASAPRGGDRRPWPTASTTTRISPAKPGPTRARPRSRAAAATPIPATVWTAGPAPVDLDATWPMQIVDTIVGAFSKPGGHVALLPWPTPQAATGTTPAARHRLGVVGPDGMVRHTRDADRGADLADALAAVERLDRTARVIRVAPDPNVTGPVSRPFWADLVDDTEPAHVTGPGVSGPSQSGIDDAVLDGPVAAAPDTDLIITSLRPDDGDGHAGDLVALVAARLLRVGGILAVLTHSDWIGGELIDPTGALVASAQNADLLYLQHIVALHVPVRDGRLATELTPHGDGPAAEQQARAAHRAAVRGLPAPHRRVHSDVLAFGQPHEHEPPPVNPTERPFARRVIR